jgi:hypothetical protein
MFFTLKYTIINNYEYILAQLWKPLILFPTFGVLEFSEVVPNYSKTIIFLFMGGFLLAMGLQKSGTHKKIAHLVLGIFPKSFIGVLYQKISLKTPTSKFVENLGGGMKAIKKCFRPLRSISALFT